MSNILPPGYVRWDGVKYVFDSDVEIIGPAGPPGAPGAPGPMGPEGPSTGPAGGDLDGDFPNPTVIKIQDQAVSEIVPTDGYYLKWDGTLEQWSGAAISKVQNYSISATLPSDGHYWKWNQLSTQWEDGPVTKIQNRNISVSTPTDGRYLKWNQSSSQWEDSVVSKIQDREISSSAPTDGNYLRWSQSATKWVDDVAVTVRVQDGSNYGKFLDIRGFSTLQLTSSTIFVNAATFVFDPTVLTSAGGTRTIKLQIVAETTGPLMSIQLYNQTAAALVTGSALSTSSTTPAILTTGDLAVNLTNGQAIYIVQIKMAAGTLSDQVNLDYAALKVEWS